MKKMIWPAGLVVGLLLLAAPLVYAQESEDEAVAALAEKFDGHKIGDFPDYEAVSRCWDGSGVTYQHADYVNDEAFGLLEPEWLLVNPNTEDIVAVSYLVKSTDGAPAEWVGEFRGLWPNQQATFGPGWVRLPVWALTDFPNESGLLADNNPTISCKAPAAAEEEAEAEAEPESEAETADESMSVEEVVAGLAAKFDGHTIDEFPAYEVMGGCFEGSGQTYENATLAEDEVFNPLEPEWVMVDPYDGTIVGVSYLVKSTDGAPAEWQDEFRPLWPQLQAFKGEGWVRLPVWALTDFPNESGLTTDNNSTIACRLPQEVQAEATAAAEEDAEAAAEEPAAAEEAETAAQPSGLPTGTIIAIVVGVVVLVGLGAWGWSRRRG